MLYCMAIVRLDHLFHYPSSFSFLIILFMILQTFGCAVFFLKRLVNGAVEKTRRKEVVSIAVAAEAIGIPRMLIDIRHGKNLSAFLDKFVKIILMWNEIFGVLIAMSA